MKINLNIGCVGRRLVNRMKERYGLVLCHDIKKNGKIYELNNQTRDRTDAGIDLLKKGKINRIIMSGGHTKEYGFPISDLMVKYAIKKGINLDNISQETLERETVGQLIFAKVIIIKPRKIKDLVIITSDYHLPRVREEAKFIFGEGYNLFFHAVTSSDQDRRSKKQERESLEAFRRTFVEIQPGDDEKILARLLEKHPKYVSDAERIRKKLMLN
jgi:uncharacterized SAM-binding protein YcdF (DUF218 family)